MLKPISSNEILRRDTRCFVGGGSQDERDLLRPVPVEAARVLRLRWAFLSISAHAHFLDLPGFDPALKSARFASPEIWGPHEPPCHQRTSFDVDPFFIFHDCTNERFCTRFVCVSYLFWIWYLITLSGPDAGKSGVRAGFNSVTYARDQLVRVPIDGQPV